MSQTHLGYQKNLTHNLLQFLVIIFIFFFFYLSPSEVILLEEIPAEEKLVPPYEPYPRNNEELNYYYNLWLKLYPFHPALEVVKPEIIEATSKNTKSLHELRVRYLSFVADVSIFELWKNGVVDWEDKEEICARFIQYWEVPMAERFDSIVDVEEFARYIYFGEKNPLEPWCKYYNVKDYKRTDG